MSALETLARLPASERRQMIEQHGTEAVRTNWSLWCQPGQGAPPGNWRTWMMVAGRGFGKTRAGAEWVRGLAESGDATTCIALVAGTIGEARNIMVEGESGLLAISPAAMRPLWEPTRGRLLWRTGAQAFIYSGENPEKLRGPQHGYAWCDELAKWAHPTETWNNLQLGLRYGERPRALITTTPRAVPLIRTLLAAPDVVVTRGTTRDNLFLPAAFLQSVTDAYGGTRWGRQELEGELLEDVAGALWTRATLEASRVREVPELRRVVVGVDPPASAGGDACGIVAVGIDANQNGYVIADVSVSGRSPEGWAGVVAGLAARVGAGPLRAIAADDRGASAGKKAVALSTDRVAATSIPEIVTLAYNDVSRDYLVGAQRAKRDGGARREMRVELPAALEAGAAKAIAEARLARLWAERSRATVTLPWRALIVGPGDRVTVPGLAGIWRVAKVIFEAMMVRLDLVLVAPASLATVAADPGRNRGQVDLPHGPTTLQVLDLPQLGDVPETTPFLAVAANGVAGGWRRAFLMTSSDGGATYADAGTTALPAVMGRTVTVLGAGSTDLIDRVNAVEVQLVHPGLTLSDADGDALLSEANLAMVGDEALQFGRATPLGNGRWRLSELWRGRRGTEWAVGLHAIDTSFVLIEAVALARLSSAATVPNAKVMAVGVGDATGVVADGPTEIGAALRPLSPVGTSVSDSGGDRIIRWTRRSREGWRWRDAVDVPLGEEIERYRLIKIASDRPDLIVEVTAPEWTYSAAERAADFAAGATTATVSVVQIGAQGVSRAASIIVPTN